MIWGSKAPGLCEAHVKSEAPIKGEALEGRSPVDAFDRPYSPNHENPSNCNTCGGWKGRSQGSIHKGSDSIFEKSGVLVLEGF